MELATGALGTLLPKLAQLLHGEYQLQKNVRNNIEFLTKELETTQAALRVLGEVPTEQLNELVRIWARDARELSYDMEDVVDTFLVLTVGKHHEIGEQIEDIKERVVVLAARRDRCKVDTVSNHITSVDVKTTELVGIEKARKEIILELTKGDGISSQSQIQKIVSIVGFGGLGKTTLAKAVYDEIGSQFDCTAFVTVSRNPDIKKFLKDMLYELDKGKYLIIIDDIWDISNWDIIKCALQDDNTGCRIITTTRKFGPSMKEVMDAPLQLEASLLRGHEPELPRQQPAMCSPPTSASKLTGQGISAALALLLAGRHPPPRSYEALVLVAHDQVPRPRPRRETSSDPRPRKRDHIVIDAKVDLIGLLALLFGARVGSAR
ncbi:hypothetical protein PR202_ga01859 [Eleusine coracana subsp. coracana]|uniref:Uncharacterized protein n=1 Tax=Eleusine coracana subsp. coracana TaxID=191504 RepID=A0AAV5BI03_ELECO|nr:hypothetical protein PR202_ga01172 [Eleusine coracana subsp. coracana]GJM86041.1 hypothetical protein PR202_ga01859 [Eleusine coracana subsp. coracana]